MPLRETLTSLEYFAIEERCFFAVVKFRQLPPVVVLRGGAWNTEAGKSLYASNPWEIG
jgi:hypothetical protein